MKFGCVDGLVGDRIVVVGKTDYFNSEGFGKGVDSIGGFDLATAVGWIRVLLGEEENCFHRGWVWTLY